jgi:hypothetical protein
MSLSGNTDISWAGDTSVSVQRVVLGAEEVSKGASGVRCTVPME